MFFVNTTLLNLSNNIAKVLVGFVNGATNDVQGKCGTLERPPLPLLGFLHTFCSEMLGSQISCLWVPHNI